MSGLEYKAMTLRFPTELHEELRREAFEKRSPITQIVLDAIRNRHGAAEVKAERLPCDQCGKPSTHTTTPGGIRLCDDFPGCKSDDLEPRS